MEWKSCPAVQGSVETSTRVGSVEERERERERGGYLSYEPDALTIACWFDFEVNEL